MVTNQFKLAFSILEVNYVDSIALAVMPTSQFPTLGTGLIESYQCHDVISKEEFLNGKMFIVTCYITDWYQLKEHIVLLSNIIS
jgi:hypothetical protein